MKLTSSEIGKSTINEKIESTNNVFNEFREFSPSLFFKVFDQITSISKQFLKGLILQKQA